MNPGDLIRSKDDSIGIVAEVLERRRGGYLAKNITDGTEFFAKRGGFRVWKTRNELAQLAILSDGGCAQCHHLGLQVYGWQQALGVYAYYLLPCADCQGKEIESLAEKDCGNCGGVGFVKPCTNNPCRCIARREFLL